MGITRRKISMNWLALGLLAVLSAGVAAPIVKSWLPEPVTCGMACCEASGVCDCQHQAGDEESISQTSQPERRTVSRGAVNIGQSCPAQCAQIPSSFQKHSWAKVTEPCPALVTTAIRLTLRRTPQIVRDALLNESHSPRAPPSLFRA